MWKFIETYEKKKTYKKVAFTKVIILHHCLARLKMASKTSKRQLEAVRAQAKKLR